MDIYSLIPVINQQFSLQEIDDEFLLYNPLQVKTVYLNSSAAQIWRLCDGERSVKNIIDFLVGLYPESGDEIASDVLVSIQELKGNEALSFRS